MPDFDTDRAAASDAVAEPRKIIIVKIYASQRWNRDGTKSYPVGKHIQAETRDKVTGEVIQEHTYSPFSTQRLLADLTRRGEKYCGMRWEVEAPK